MNNLEERINRIKELPEDTMFFIVNGYVGNSFYFWALGSSGYTIDPYKAQQYNKNEIINQMRCNRDKDSFYIVDGILEAVSYHVDSQYVKPGTRI